MSEQIHRTLEDRADLGSSLPAVLPLQHGDTFAIGDRTFTFERQGVSSDVPSAPLFAEQVELVRDVGKATEVANLRAVQALVEAQQAAVVACIAASSVAVSASS